jgi:tetratricopeptide (TPR) repeat protein
MAKRRLNKKVALIGSAVFTIIAFVFILAIFMFKRTPEELVQDALTALNAAHESTDEQVKEQNYDRAERSFQRAYVRAKDDDLRQEILFKMLDMYLETQEWPFIVACWDEIININPNNARARYGRLRYFQILGQSGVTEVWPRVCEETTEFLKVAENTGLMMKQTAQWDVPGIEMKGTHRQYLGPYLYLLRGIGSLEMARSGAATNKDEMLEQAIEDFRKVQQLDPNNIDTYWQLARSVIAKGEIASSRGNFEEREKSIEQAKGFLVQAVTVADSNPKAHINLLQLNLMLAGENSPDLRKEQIGLLENDFLSLGNRFSSNAEVFAAISEFYLTYSKYCGPGQNLKNLNKAIEAIENAMVLDTQNIVYVINAADLYYRRFSISKQEEDLRKAIQIALNAASLPQAQDVPGPQHQSRIVNRFQLYALLGNCYMDQILDPEAHRSEIETKTLLSSIERAVHEIEQIFGSREQPLVVKWQGMLELARGHRKDAVTKLYSAYEQLKALKPSEPPWPKDYEFARLSYTLASIFKKTPELGAVHEFLLSALYSGIMDIKPEAQLDYAEVALELNPWTEVIQHISAFDLYHGSNVRSRDLRIKTYIRTMQFEKAEKELAARADQDADTIKLHIALVQAKIRQAQLAIAQKQKKDKPSIQEFDLKQNNSAYMQADDSQYSTQEIEGLKKLEAALSWKLLSTEPNAVEPALFVGVCRNYIEQNEISQAKDFTNRFLESFPQHATALIYKQLLQEPVPQKVPEQRYKQIEEQTLLSLNDPIKRALQLGIFYHRNNDFEKAAQHLINAMEQATSTDHVPGDSVYEQIKLAADYLFDIALAKDNWPLAEQVIETARDEDLDECHGMIFEARFAAAKGEFKNALTKINECLKQRPLYSRAYFLRSNIQTALGNDAASREDIYKAASLNPLDGMIAKKAAIALYYRNQNLGQNVLPNQVAETKRAFERAIRLNLSDLELLSLYAELIAPTEPLRAVAIRQDIQENAPSIENALLLGKMAMEIALKQTNQDQKDVLFGIAGSAFEQAKKMDPHDKRMLYYYSQYYRERGMETEAMKLLSESQDAQLLWNHYLELGRYADARNVLEQAHQSDPKNIEILKGLIMVAEKTSDQESVRKYSQELISFEDTLDNNLAQIQAFLRTGLIQEAEHKLQAVKEKYPKEPRILLLQAWLLLRQGRLEEALDLTNKNLLTERDNAVAWRLRGEIYIKQAEYEKAISDLRQSKLLSDDPVTRVSLARAYLGAKRYEDAITELKNTIVAPDAPQEARLLLEHIYTRLERKEALSRFYQETLEKFPDDTNWLNRAGAFALKTGQYEKAEQLYQKSCQIRRQANGSQNPEELIKDLSYATALDGYLKALLMGSGEPDKNNWNPDKISQVLDESTKYLNSSFSPVAYLRMAEANYKLGNKANVAKYCQAAIEKTDTNETLASEVLMRMFLMLGADEVSKFCRQRLETHPDSIAANYAMFNLVSIQGKYAEAIRYINKCIELTDSKSPRRIDYIIKKADTLMQAYEQTSDNKYIRTAITDYESLLSEMPKNINVLNNFAYTLAEYNQRLPEALQYAQQALDAKPDDPGIMDTYAYVLYKNGKNQEAAEYVEAALQQYSDQNITLVPPEVYEHKGMIEENLGDKGEALAAYQMALETGADRLTPGARQRINKAIERVSP